MTVSRLNIATTACIQLLTHPMHHGGHACADWPLLDKYHSSSSACQTACYAAAATRTHGVAGRSRAVERSRDPAGGCADGRGVVVQLLLQCACRVGRWRGRRGRAQTSASTASVAAASSRRCFLIFIRANICARGGFRSARVVGHSKGEGTRASREARARGRADA